MRPSTSRFFRLSNCSACILNDLFDGALSNFSGLNCVANLQQTARDLAALVTPGAPVLLCFSTRFCLAETIWFAFHGQFRKAFRRSSGMATAKVSGFSVKVQYPTLAGDQEDVCAILSPALLYWDRRSGSAIVSGTIGRANIRGRSACSRRIDKRISRLPWLRTIGDHMLIHFERVEG